MNKSLIWIAAGIAGIGFGIPAYAAMSSNNAPPTIAPAATVVSTPSVVSVPRAATIPSTPATVVSVPVVMAPVVSAATAPEDASSSCTEPGHATDDRCTGVDGPDVTTNPTATSVEDVNGSCDEPEHVNDDRCTSTATATGTATVTVTDDRGGQSNSGHGADDGAHHGGSSDG